MLLTSVQSTGLKGQSFKVELAPGTAIVGPNATGKTAIIEAIKFVCRGTFPEVKKGSWPEMEATGEFDNGTAIIRSINSKGTVQTSAGDPGGTIDPATLDVPLLDPEHYFGLTDTQRTNYVFERIKLPDSFKAESIASEIERLSLGEAHTDLIEKAKADIVFDVRSIFKDSSFTVQEALGVAVENMRTRFTYWNKRAKETQGAVTTLTELKLREKNVVAAPADLERQIQAKTKAISEANHELGQLRQKALDAETTCATHLSLEKYLKAERIDYDAMLKRARERQQPLAHEFERINDAIMAIDIDSLKRQLAQADIEQRKAGEAAAVFDEACSDFTKSIEDLDKQDHCPYCQAKAKGWKEAARVKLQERLKKAEQTKKAQLTISKKAESDVTRLKKNIESYNDIKARADAIKQKLKTLGDEIDRVAAEKERDDKRRADWKERLSKIGAPPDPASFKSEISQLENKLETAQKEMDLLNDQRTAETRLRQDIQRASESAQEHNAAAAQVTVTKKVGKLLDDRRSAMVESAFGALLKTANQFAEGILKTPLAMSDGVIGRWEKSTFISHHWFSGTEKAITYVAIGTALSSTAPFKLLILDEFGRLDEVNKWKVLKRLDDLRKEGVIDQYVIAGTELPDIGGRDRTIKGLKIIKVNDSPA